MTYSPQIHDSIEHCGSGEPHEPHLWIPEWDFPNGRRCAGVRDTEYIPADLDVWPPRMETKTDD